MRTLRRGALLGMPLALAVTACGGSAKQAPQPTPPIAAQPSEAKTAATPAVAEKPPMKTATSAMTDARPAAGQGANNASQQTAAPARAGLPPEVRTKLTEGVNAAQSSPDKAIEIFGSIDAAPAYYNQGVLYEHQGKYSDAERAYKKAISLDPNYLAAVENLANLAVRQQDMAAAEGILLDAIKRAPADLNLRNRLIAVWLGSNKVEAAENEAKKILKADERNVGALVNLATVFFRRGQLELATTVLNRAKDIDPQEPMIWINLGFVNLAQNENSKAVEVFKKATELRSDLPEAHNNLGALFVQAHDYDAAITSLQKALSLYPTFARAYVNLGNAYKGNKQYKQAEAAYKKAYDLESSNTAVLYNLGVLHLDNLIEGTDRLKRFDISKDYLAQYLAASKNLSAEERQRVEGFIAEADRGHKREEQKLKNEERKAKMDAKQKEKEKAAADKAAADKAAADKAAPGEAPKGGDGAKPGEAPKPGDKPAPGGAK